MIYVFSGTNSHAAASRLRQIVENHEKEYGRSSIERYRGEEVGLNELPAILTSQSLLSPSRLIIFRDLVALNKPAAEKLIELIRSIPESNTVVLREGELDKRTSAYKKLSKLEGFTVFDEPSDGELSIFVDQYLREQGGAINSAAKKELLLRVGKDQSRLKNELDKLLSYAEDEVTLEMVELLVEKRVEDKVFDLLEAALGGKSNLAQDLLSEMRDSHQDPFQVIGMLIWQVHILAVIQSAKGLPESQIAKEAKLHPFVVQKSKKLTSRMTTKDLNNILDLVARLDIKSKSSSLPIWHQLEKAISEITKIVG